MLSMLSGHLSWAQVYTMLCQGLGSRRFWMGLAFLEFLISWGRPRLRSLIPAIMVWEPRTGTSAQPELEGKEVPEEDLDGWARLNRGRPKQMRAGSGLCTPWYACGSCKLP